MQERIKLSGVATKCLTFCKRTRFFFCGGGGISILTTITICRRLAVLAVLAVAVVATLVLQVVAVAAAAVVRSEKRVIAAKVRSSSGQKRVGRLRQP